MFKASVSPSSSLLRTGVMAGYRWSVLSIILYLDCLMGVRCRISASKKDLGPVPDPIHLAGWDSGLTPVGRLNQLLQRALDHTIIAVTSYCEI